MQRIQLDIPPARYIDTAEELERVVAEARAIGKVALDTEGTGLDLQKDIPLFGSMATNKWRVAFPAQIFHVLHPLLTDPKVILGGMNFKFDLHMFVTGGGFASREIPTLAQIHDVMSMAAITDSSRYSRSLKNLIVSVYGRNDPHSIRYHDFNETFDTKRKGMSIGEMLMTAPLEVILNYATCDAWATYQLRDTFESQMREITTWRGNTLWDIFTEVEVPFYELLWRMERTGAKIDAPRMRQLETDWTREMGELERRFCTLAGRTVNLKSPKQLRQYFLVDKGLTSDRVTKGGSSGNSQAAVDKLTLEKWAAEGIEEAIILTRHRILKTLVSKELKGLLGAADHNDRVHTQFDPNGARTGRISSRNPALMNIPVRTKDGKLIRACFITDPDDCLVVRDYDQGEMKLAAAFSGDPIMLALINAGKDIHAGNASIAFDVDYDELMAAVAAKDSKDKNKPPLTKQQEKLLDDRGAAKTLGFGLLYGEGLRKLATQMKCTVGEARVRQDKFLGAFHILREYIKKSHARMAERLHVQTIMGRKRAMPGAALPQGSMARAKAEREGFNCLDGLTEALTLRGWVYGFDLTPEDVLLTKNSSTGGLEWQKPTKLWLYPDYAGELYEFKSKTFHAVSTPEHRWLVRDKATRRDVCRHSRQISPHGDHRIHRTGTYPGAASSPWSDDQVHLAGWFLTDGGYEERPRNKGPRPMAKIFQSQRANPENCQEIAQLIERLEAGAWNYTDPETTQTTWTLNELISAELHALFPRRLLTVNFMRQLTKYQLSLLLETMLKADGSANTTNHRTFCASNKEDADLFQTLCVLCGVASNYYTRDMTDYHPKLSEKMHNSPRCGIVHLVSLLRRDTAQVLKHHRRIFKDRRGVWCPSVPNGYFVARRSGRVFITGNCEIQGSLADITKLAMLRIWRDPRFQSLGWKLILQVHDEIIGEGPKESAEEANQIMGHHMTNCLEDIGVRLQVVMSSSGHACANWAEGK